MSEEKLDSEIQRASLSPKPASTEKSPLIERPLRKQLSHSTIWRAVYKTFFPICIIAIAMSSPHLLVGSHPAVERPLFIFSMMLPPLSFGIACAYIAINGAVRRHDTELAGMDHFEDESLSMSASERNDRDLQRFLPFLEEDPNLNSILLLAKYCIMFAGIIAITFGDMFSENEEFRWKPVVVCFAATCTLCLLWWRYCLILGKYMPPVGVTS